MVLAEFQMFPTDVGESKSKYVAMVIDIVDKSGLEYMMTPMGTILEGGWEQVMDVISDCFHVLEPQCNRISVSVKVDYRKGTASRLKSKVEKVESILNKKLRK